MSGLSAEKLQCVSNRTASKQESSTSPPLNFFNLTFEKNYVVVLKISKINQYKLYIDFFLFLTQQQRELEQPQGLSATIQSLIIFQAGITACRGVCICIPHLRNRYCWWGFLLACQDSIHLFLQFGDFLLEQRTNTARINTAHRIRKLPITVVWRVDSEKIAIENRIIINLFLSQQLNNLHTLGVFL